MRGPRNSRFALAVRQAPALLLLAAGIVGSAATLDMGTRLLGDAGWERTSVSAVNPHDPERHFSRGDLERISWELPGRDLAFASTGAIADVVAGTRGFSAHVIGVSPSYGRFFFLPMVRGGFFTDRAEADAEPVVVIGTDLAWKLFLTREAAGVEVRIDGRTFRVVGIYEDGHTLLDAMIDDGLPRVYVPFATLGRGDIATFQVAAAREDVERALRSTGRNPTDLAIEEFDMLLIAAEQRVAVIVFLAAAGAALVAVKLLISRMRAFAVSLRAEMHDYWFRQALRRRSIDLAICCGWLLLAAGGLYLLWRLARFEPLVPARFFPDHLTDLGYYVDLAKSLLREANSLRGFVPPTESRIAEAMCRIQRWLQAAGLAGILLVVRARHPEGELAGAVAVRALAFAGSLSIVWALCLVFGLPLRADLGDLVVFWAFVFLSALRKELPHDKESRVRAASDPGAVLHDGHHSRAGI